MKVLQVVKTNEGALWAFAQAKWLHDNGIDIVTVLPEIEGGMASKYKAHGMSVLEGDFSLPIGKPWKLPSRLSDIQRVVEEAEPDVIHCHFVTNIMMVRLALRESNLPRLFQVPGPLHLENRMFRQAELSLAKCNDFWAGGCQHACAIYLDSGVPQSRVFLAYYGGYGGTACDEYGERTNTLHEQYKLPSDSILVGMVSYFYKPKIHLLQTRGLKGHEDFIDAIALVRRKDPRVRGVIIGDSWGNSQNYVKRVKRYAKKRCGEDIVFTGFRTDVKEIYRELNIAVHPSHSENLGGAAESLAAGVPTISTNVGGFPDLVVDGQTGILVEAKCPAALAAAILKMIANPNDAQQMAGRGRERVRHLLDIEHTAKNVLSIYKEITKS